MTASWVGAVAALVCGFAGSCGGRSTTPEAVLPRPDLRLIVVTDLKGYLEPCGCTSRPLGGIDHLAAAVAHARSDGAPTLFVSAGGLLFEGRPRGGPGTETQEIWQAEAITDILGRLELDAAGLSLLELHQGASTFARIARGARFPFVASGTDLTAGEGAPPVRASVVEHVGGLAVGIVAVAELEGPSGALPEGVRVEGDLRDRARGAVSAVRAEGAKLVVVLVSGSRRAARQVAALEGVDFVIEGGLDEKDAQPPAVEGAVILHAGRQGQGLVVADVYRRGDGAFVDASPWSRDAQRAHLDEELRELRARIAAWAQDPATRSEDLATQRARLEGMQRERAALDAPSALPAGNCVVARYEELPPSAPSDPAIAALVDAHDARVNDHNREAFASLLPVPAPEGQASYVGSEACGGSCHAEALRWWRTTQHGHAYATLVERHKEFNLSCVGCHVTGYNRPGGSTVAHVENLQNVGCESCHGPGSRHVAEPSAPGLVTRAVPERVCVSCHEPEHSDLFRYETFRQILIVPGHGLPP